MNILLIEDSESLRRSLKIGLTSLGYQVDTCGDGAEGLSMVLQETFDLIILDLMLPSVDGMQILKSIKKQNIDSKVIILSARDLSEDKVNGLLEGADDYLTKPFSFNELHARIIAVQRRGKTQFDDHKIPIDNVILDIHLKELIIDGKDISLTPKEFGIVECLFINQGRVISAEKISEYLVGNFDAISKNTIEAHLTSIRKKFKHHGATSPIETKRGFGYIVR